MNREKSRKKHFNIKIFETYFTELKKMKIFNDFSSGFKVGSMILKWFLSFFFFSRTIYFFASLNNSGRMFGPKWVLKMFTILIHKKNIWKRQNDELNNKVANGINQFQYTRVPMLYGKI